MQSYYTDLYDDIGKISYSQISHKHDGNVVTTERFTVHGCYGNESVANDAEDTDKKYDCEKEVMFKLR